LSPNTLRDKLAKENVAAFSTRNIGHIGHEYLHLRALDSIAELGINVITGAQYKGSFLPDVIFDVYQEAIATFYPKGRVHINNLRIPPIYGGPKETYLQATMLQNLGYTHFIIGRDHAGVGGYYDKYASQKIFESLRDLNITIIKSPGPRFCLKCMKVNTENDCQHSGIEIRELNGRDVRRCLVERRFDDLKNIVRPEVQEMLITIGEIGFDEKSGLKAERNLFFT
jgi:sulfate adenylyltransferase